MSNIKLTIELVPKTSHYNNVRSAVSASRWDEIRNACYEKAQYKCEICGDKGTNQGVKWNVECHEIWRYEDSTKEQVLDGVIALCPNCHKVKHTGLANINGEMPIVLAQLQKVNNWSLAQSRNYIKESFKTWRQRSQHQWKVIIDILNQL